MEEFEYEKKREKSIKFLDIRASNFKKAKKVSPLRNSINTKKKKSVVFFEPEKELRNSNLKKTQIATKPHMILERKFQTQIGTPKKKKNKNNNLSLSKISSGKSRNMIKMPTLKTKVVNIHKHYFIPIITKITPSTFISNKKEENPVRNKRGGTVYKRVNTAEKKFKKLINFNDDSNKEKSEKNDIKNEKLEKIKGNIKPLSIINKNFDNKSNVKSILKKSSTMTKITNNNKPNIKRKNYTYIERNNQNYEKKINEEKSDRKGKKGKKEEKTEKKRNIIKNESDSESESDFEEEKIEDVKSKYKNKNKKNNNLKKKEEKFDDNKNDEIIEIGENDDKLTNNKGNPHIRNSSVDEINKKGKKKWNDNIIKKLLCCLYGS